MNISILTTTYNTHPKELIQSIESVLSQTFDDFEFIIINDGSKQYVEDIILSYNDKRIKYIKNETNQGIIKSANKGLELCQGKYIARLDADDFCVPERLEKQYDFMEKHPDIGVSASYFKILELDNRVVITPTKDNDIKLCHRYAGYASLCNPACIIRKSVLNEYNIKYDKNCLHAEDYKMFSDLTYVTNTGNIPEPLTTIRTNEDGISKTNRLWINKMIALIRLDNMIKDFPCDKKFMYKILGKFVRNIPIDNLEYETLKLFLNVVTAQLRNQISSPFNQHITNPILSILTYFPRLSH